MINLADSKTNSSSENKPEENIVNSLFSGMANLLNPKDNKEEEPKEKSKSDPVTDAIAYASGVDSEIPLNVVPLPTSDNTPPAPIVNTTPAPPANTVAPQAGGFNEMDENSKYWEMKYYKYKSKYLREKEMRNL
tara:strand:+ start:122 stop:523 length:402 start_codon:yes stop_codon:yes gene_type:complete